MANVDLHTKLGGNRSRNGWDTHVYIFLRWRPSAILDLSFPFWTTNDVALGGLHFACQWRNDPILSGWNIAILIICWFGWKMPFGRFLGFGPRKWSDIVETPKGTNGCKTRHLSWRALELLNTTCSLGKERNGYANSKNRHRNAFFTHLQRRNGLNYSNELFTLNHWLDVVIYLKRHPNCYIGLRGPGMQIFAFSIDFSIAF